MKSLTSPYRNSRWPKFYTNILKIDLAAIVECYYLKDIIMTLYIALVLVVIIVIVVLLRFLFGVLFIIPISIDHQVGMLLIIRGIPSSSLIQYNPSSPTLTMYCNETIKEKFAKFRSQSRHKDVRKCFRQIFNTCRS